MKFRFFIEFLANVFGGLAQATEYEVRCLFAQYGNISSVKIISDRAGVSRGYGIAHFGRDVPLCS